MLNIFNTNDPSNIPFKNIPIWILIINKKTKTQHSEFGGN
jgi:hypothetical protein